MILAKYNCEIDDEAIYTNLKRITNQIYKLLPSREEEIDWKTPLSTIIEELSGMNILLVDQQDILFSLLCKLEGLFQLDQEQHFFEYRRTIFECLSLMNSIIKKCQV